MASPILSADPRRSSTLTAGVLLVASLTAIALRLGEWIPNVTAVGALALYAGGRLRWWLAWLPPRPWNIMIPGQPPEGVVPSGR